MWAVMKVDGPYCFVTNYWTGSNYVFYTSFDEAYARERAWNALYRRDQHSTKQPYFVKEFK